MRASLRALLTGVIDYAGLFPPAALPLEQAFRNYVRYRQGPERWMLGRFVCPAARLAELAPYVEALAPSGSLLTLSVLGKGGNTTREFLGGLIDDLEAIHSFWDALGDRARIDAYELRLPAEVIAFDKPGMLRLVLHGSNAMLAQQCWLAMSCYFELASGRDFMAPFGVLMGALIEDRSRTNGFKLRCGGLEADAFPTPGDVAFALAGCQTVGVPMKCTAGLHHPLRHYDSHFGTHVHGFLNVFGAGVLNHARHLSLEQIQPILEEEDPGNFRFEEDGLRWKDWHATTEEIAIARQRAVISFGSCSFDEPCDGLRALGLL